MFYFNTHFFLYIFIFIWSFLPYKMSGQTKTSDILGDNKNIAVPFQYVQGFIIVDVLVNYIFPMKFIVDTGAEHTIILDRTFVDILQIPLDKEIKVVGSDVSREILAWVVRGIPFQFMEGMKTHHDFIVLDEDVMDLGSITGVKIDGILGSEFLKNFIVEINFKKSVMFLHAQNEKNHKWDKYQSLPLVIHSNKPYLKTFVDVKGNGLKELLLLIDTGASLSLLVHTESDSLHLLPEHILKGVLGRGLGGDVLGYSGKISEFTIGQDTFEQVVSSFQALDSMYLAEETIIRDGIIGNFILDHFHLVFHFPENRLLFKKNSKKKISFRYDKSGLIIYAFGPRLNQYYIHHVIDGSPAHEAGLVSGDIIRKIGFWPVRYYTLDRIHQKMTKENKEVKIEVQRNNKKIVTKIKLRDLYNS